MYSDPLTAWGLLLISLLLVQTVKMISILLLCQHWCDREVHCAGFTQLELEVCAWHSKWNCVGPWGSEKNCAKADNLSNCTRNVPKVTGSTMFMFNLFALKVTFCYCNPVRYRQRWPFLSTCLHPVISVFFLRKEERHVKVICVCLRVPWGGKAVLL